MRTTLHRHISGFLFALPFAAATACGDADAPDDTPIIQAALQVLAESEIEEHGFNGLGISVRLAGGRVIRADAGYADPARRAAYDGTRTEQIIGSVTKLYTAVLAMQLVEAGDLALEETLDRWFDFPGSEVMTVRMLLQHRIGLADTIENMTLPDFTRPWTPEQLLELARGFDRYGQAPLARPVYTNTAFLLLGMIIESETGKAWEDNVAERIARPLGLRHTYYAGESGKAGGLAGGWMLTDGGWIDTIDLLEPSAGWCYGAVVTTNDELMRFTEALFDGELFDDPATLDAMLRFDETFDPAYLPEELPNQRVGLAVIQMDADGVRLEGHLGHFAGFNAAALRDPDSGALIVVTSNDDRAYAAFTVFDVAKLVRGL